MSTAINNYSLSNASMINAGSAGSDLRKKFSFDDLLLFPSVAANNAASKNYLCYSARASPVLPPIARDADIQRKYNTAPASPNHHDYLSSTVTPQTSPLYARARLAATAARLPDYCPVNQQESLPSLRHLQLLPNPRIQESACYYPDTSEHTPIWKRTLVHWCKEKNYQDYTKIVHEISHDRTQLAALLKASNSSPKAAGIPSVLRPKDAFQGLSDYAQDKSTPMTPPMSPLDELSKDQPPEFTPFVSSKLVQTVKQQSTSSGSKSRHKKTNSFKAMQLKKMFNSRDVLASDSQTNATKYKVSKRSSVSAASSGSSSSDDSARLKKLEISDAARSLVISLGAHGRRPTSPVRSSESIVSSITTPTKVSKPADSRSRSSSRSHSPVRPATPPHTATSSSYHRFAYDSPQSPVATLRQGPSGNIKTTPKRRRSSGSSTHGVPRKCVSCHSNDSPCWRPSWSGRKQDQLCNSCGLRYKKTHTRCLNEACRKIPTKSELGIMRSNGLLEEHNADGTVTRGYRCLFCNSIAETTDAISHHHA